MKAPAQFELNGKRYKILGISMAEWYESGNAVRLPDGSFWKPFSWYESNPPIPADFKEVRPQPGSSYLAKEVFKFEPDVKFELPIRTAAERDAEREVLQDVVHNYIVGQPSPIAIDDLIPGVTPSNVVVFIDHPDRVFFDLPIDVYTAVVDSDTLKPLDVLCEGYVMEPNRDRKTGRISFRLKARTPIAPLAERIAQHLREQFGLNASVEENLSSMF